MHPPLKRPHHRCSKEVEALVKCHEENPYKKFMGVCNKLKTDLDRCFALEKEETRRQNAGKARESNKMFEEFMREERERKREIAKRAARAK